MHTCKCVLARCGTPELVDNSLVEQQRHCASGTVLHFIPVAAGSRDGVDGQAQAGLVIEDLRKSGRAKRRRWAFGTGSGLGFGSPLGRKAEVAWSHQQIGHDPEPWQLTADGAAKHMALPFTSLVLLVTLLAAMLGVRHYRATRAARQQTALMRPTCPGLGFGSPRGKRTSCRPRGT
jgi:hypothetical protein